MKARVAVGGCLRCSKCETWLPLAEFNRDRTSATGYGCHCKPCKKAGRSLLDEARKEKRRTRQRERWAANPERRAQASEWSRSVGGKQRKMFYCARERAREKGVPFSITPTDITIPDRCPLLGVALEFGRGKLHANSPSLDRLRPELGYVPGNVIVVSYRANAIKHDATPEELERIAAALRKLLG